MKTFNECLTEGLFDWWKGGQGQQATPMNGLGQQNPQAVRHAPPEQQRQPQDFNTFLQQFAVAPYHINPYDLKALMSNPNDREALDRISNRDGYVGRMIQRFKQTGGQEQDHEPAQWTNDDYWGGSQGR